MDLRFCVRVGYSKQKQYWKENYIVWKYQLGDEKDNTERHFFQLRLTAFLVAFLITTFANSSKNVHLSTMNHASQHRLISITRSQTHNHCAKLLY